MNKIYNECKTTNDGAVRAAASAGNREIRRSSSLRRLERRWLTHSTGRGVEMVEGVAQVFKVDLRT